MDDKKQASEGHVSGAVCLSPQSRGEVLAVNVKHLCRKVK